MGAVKILHLSDLHLGKRVFECSMIEQQRVILSQALDMAKRADVTVIAGDIYDRQVPPAEAVALLSDFLTQMRRQGSPVLLISGNHDSAERIAFGSGLLDAGGVYVSPVYDGAPRRVDFEDEHGVVQFHLLPFIKPAHVRAALEKPEIEGYTQALREAIGAMELDPSARHVLLAHQFVTGGMRSESEEISVGGLDNVDADVFAPFDYGALGHLHAPQSLCGGRVRYSGAPLCYAFSECGDVKGALLVTLGKKGELEAEKLPFEPEIPMKRLRGRFDELLRAQTDDAYLQITLTDEEDMPDAARRLSQVYPNVLQVLYDNARTRAAQADFTLQQAVRRDPVQMFASLYELQNGQPMSGEQDAFLRAMMEKIWEDDA